MTNLSPLTKKKKQKEREKRKEITLIKVNNNIKIINYILKQEKINIYNYNNKGMGDQGRQDWYYFNRKLAVSDSPSAMGY